MKDIDGQRVRDIDGQGVREETSKDRNDLEGADRDRQGTDRDENGHGIDRH